MNTYQISVLLIGNSEDDYRLTRDILGKVDNLFLLEWTADYNDALKRIAEHRHDVYLVDDRLGENTGVELVQNALQQGCTAPIILMAEQTSSSASSIPANASTVNVLVKEDLVKEDLVKEDLVKEINLPLLERAIRHAVECHPVWPRSHSLPNLILNSVGEGICGLDAQHIIRFINPAAARLVGWAIDELLGQSIYGIYPSFEPLGCDEVTPKNNSTGVTHPSTEGWDWLQRKDGSQCPVVAIATPLLNHYQLNHYQLNHYQLDHCHPVGTVITFQTITKRQQIDENLRDREERYALVLKGTNDGIWDWNLNTDDIYFSPRWKAMLGYDEEELPNHQNTWFSRVHPEDLYRLKRDLQEHFNGQASHFESEYRLHHQDGTYRWMLSRGMAVRDACGKASRMVGAQTDITDRKTAESQLLHHALYDSLTHLPNRTLFVDRLRHSVQLANRRETYHFAVLFLDIDRFKVINDSLGHAVGDRLLMEIANRLTECLRPGDTLARLGGDEFVILLEGFEELNTVTGVADRVQRELAKPFSLNGQEICTTASIGIALSLAGYNNAEDLLRDADTAMYRAKAQGRARYAIFHAGMHTHAVALLQLETDLRRAIERRELKLYYQAIVSLKTGRIAGFEALVRWVHPERGFVSPVEFIPLAEETGLIIPLGIWVLEEACRQMRVWQTQFPLSTPLTISVNLSAKQFNPLMIEQIKQVLHTTELDARCLKLEITESVLMENTESAARMLAELQNIGIQLSMDDFGTGYSSLSYLHRFPIDILKIDRSFISKIDSDPEQLAIVRTITTLAWNLGLEVVAEGVETGKQLSQLRALKCDYAQGFYFSKPVDSEVASQLIASDTIVSPSVVVPFSRNQD